LRRLSNLLRPQLAAVVGLSWAASGGDHAPADEDGPQIGVGRRRPQGDFAGEGDHGESVVAKRFAFPRGAYETRRGEPPAGLDLAIAVKLGPEAASLLAIPSNVEVLRQGHELGASKIAFKYGKLSDGRAVTGLRAGPWRIPARPGEGAGVRPSRSAASANSAAPACDTTRSPPGVISTVKLLIALIPR
jgi:hypothetical protein